jgi:hypothetical protein
MAALLRNGKDASEVMQMAATGDGRQKHLDFS